MEPDFISKVHTNQRLVLREILRRGASVEAVDLEKEIFRIEKGGRFDFLIDRFGEGASFCAARMTADKNIARKVLRAAGIPAPRGEVFDGFCVSRALEFYEALGAPECVLKPNWGSHGDAVACDIRSAKDLELEIYKFVAERGREEAFVVEEQIPGTERRIFMTRLGEYAVARREPASVEGDGRRTIEELVRLENERRGEFRKSRETSLCPICLDDEALRHMAGMGLGPDSVLAEGRRAFLRRQSNLAKGGLAVNETDLIHPAAVELAKRALACFPGLPCAGFDFICEDIGADPAGQVCAFIEVNSNPGLAMHAFPTSGESEEVARYCVNAHFGWLGEGA